MTNSRPNMNALVPSQSNSNQEPLEQPRQPRNLQGLLAYSMQAHGNTVAQASQPLSEQDRQWLNAALTSCTVNVIEEMNKAITIIKDHSDDDKSCGQALRTIANYVDSADTANDFHKIGGFEVLPVMLHSAHSSLRTEAANLIAELTQNNPYCQEKVQDLQPLLINLLVNDHNQGVRIKALYALSCCLRDYPPSLQLFLQHEGLSALMMALQSGSDKLRTKAAFLLSSLCSQSADVRDQLHEMKMVEQLTMLLESHDQPYEHLLSAMLILVREHPESAEECRHAHLRLRQTLDKLEESSGEELLEQAEYCREIRKLVFSNDSKVEDR